MGPIREDGLRLLQSLGMDGVSCGNMHTRRDSNEGVDSSGNTADLNSDGDQDVGGGDLNWMQVVREGAQDVASRAERARSPAFNQFVSCSETASAPNHTGYLLRTRHASKIPFVRTRSAF